MSYERLELIDGVTKWDTEKVQHLEDAIIKNENDIQKYHNDTIVEVQADWNQEDETAKDYVKNRTHYPYKGAHTLIYSVYYEFNGDYDERKTYGSLPYEQIIESDLSENEAPGYWLGSMGGYCISGHEQSFTADAYSNWSVVETVDLDTYYYCGNGSGMGFYVCVQLIESNSYKVTLTQAYTDVPDFGYSIYTLGLNYKKLDDVYLSDDIARDPDWEENNPRSPSYIKNRPFYVEYSTAEPYELIYHPINEKFIPDTIARITDIPFTDDISWDTIGSQTVETFTVLNYSNIDASLPLPGVVNTKLEIGVEYEITIEGNSFNGTYSFTPDDDYNCVIIPGQLYCTYDPISNEYQFNTISTFVVPEPEPEVSLWFDYIEIICPSREIIIPIKENYLPDTIARIDSVVTSFNGKVGDVEVSYSDLGIINEEYIPESIARKSEVETVASFSESLEDNFQQYTLTNDVNLNNITANLRDITDNMQKLNNKQIEDYFVGYEEELLVYEFLKMAVNLGHLKSELIRPLHLKFVNQLTEEFQIIIEDDPYLTIEEHDGIFSFTYNNPNGSVITYFTTDGKNDMACNSVGNIDDIVVYQLIPVSGKKKLDEKYISDSIARAPKATFDDIEEAPTASDFNTLLSILREAGILATE